MAELYPKFKWHNPQELTDSVNNLGQIYRNFWWIVDAEGRICIYRERSPQANRDKAITQTLFNRGYLAPEAVGIKQIELVIIPYREEY